MPQIVRIILISVIVLSFNLRFSISQTKVGVAIPLMTNSENPDEKRLGVNMMMGINAALKEYNTLNSTKMIVIDVRDTRRDPSEALQIINELGSDSNVIAVLGPVYSSELVKNVGAAMFHKMPVVTPTATQNFLAQNNPYIFQLNPTYDVRGRVMANFAGNDLKMQNFAIFSEEDYGKNFADSFKDEVSKNGGNITCEVYYSKEKTDMQSDVLELRNKIFEKDRFVDFGTLTKPQIEKIKNVKIKYSGIDTLLNKRALVSIYKLFGSNGQRVSDSLGLTSVPLFDSDLKGKIVIPLTDAVYIPISNALEITRLALQYFSDNINIPILGTSDWNNPTLLDINKNYINNLYFDSDFYVKEKTQEDYSKGDIDIRNYYFGYDAMKLLLDKIGEGNNTRKSLNEALEKVTDFKAKHGNITIKQRTNQQMTIMNYSNGVLKRVGE